MESTLLFYVLFTIVHTSWTLTPHDPCPDLPPVVSLNLKGCTQLPCSFVKGSTIEFIIEVLADRDIKTLTADVKAFALGTETTYPLPGDVGNVCDHLLDGECPLEAGEDVKYHLLFPISESYPAIPLVIQFSIVSEFGTIGCLRLPSVVVDS
uniref:Niemann-Pick type C2 protein a n=1 Tax=Adelphocoris lineolatus TaxID=236346 RepID=A0A346RVH4_ADELI|nr:Niemann-Pick type C2 protein a [Adelphocoris lineolatus]